MAAKKPRTVVPLRTVEQHRRKANKPEPKPHLWECRVCEADIGVATTDIIQIRTGAHIKGLKVVGGYKRWVCARCYVRGIITPLIR